MPEQQHPVPVKTIVVTIGLVMASGFGLYVIYKLSHIWTLLVVAAFFAIVLTPAVDFLRRHLRVSRGMSTAIVFLLGLVLITTLLYAFIQPLVVQTQEFIDDFPTYVSEAKAGRGPLGGLVKRFELDRRIEENQERLNRTVNQAGGDAVKWAGKIFAGIVSTVTVLVLAVLMILYGPQLLTSGLGALSPPKRERVQAVATDCARAITGYVMGNLLISVVAGTVTFIALSLFGVPFAGVLALFVAFTDLIPLIGATLGAIPTILISFLHSTTAGVGMLIVYVVYQQFENHVLQVTIMAKTVHINQLFVLVSVLIGVELLGLLGALLAIPVAGILSVIVRDLWDNRTGRFKEEPTVGEDEVPISEVVHDDDEDTQKPALPPERERPQPALEPASDGAADERSLSAGPAPPAGEVPAEVPVERAPDRT